MSKKIDASNIMAAKKPAVSKGVEKKAKATKSTLTKPIISKSVSAVISEKKVTKGVKPSKNDQQTAVLSTRKPRKPKPFANMPVNVLMRVRSEDGRTISAHERIIAAKGSALLGKIGKGLGPDFIKLMNGQIGRGVNTYLFLTTREGWNGPYVTFMCRLKGIETTLPESKRDLAPSYYAASFQDVNTWFEISSIAKMSRSDMNRITVISSGREIMSVIGSSASIFHVVLKIAANSSKPLLTVAK